MQQVRPEPKPLETIDDIASRIGGGIKPNPAAKLNDLPPSY